MGVERICEECGSSYLARKEFAGYTRRFCSSRCSGKANSRRTLATYPPREEIVQLYCEGGLSDRELGARFGHTYQWAFKVRQTYGIGAEEKPARKPTRRRSSNGYMRLGNEYEHRKVMEEKIGRPLTQIEVVHHVDGNPENNDPGNLVLYPSHSEHMWDERGRRARSPRRSTARVKRRDWTDAREKVEAEGKCRVCARSGIKLDAAHIIPRSRVLIASGAGEHPDNIVPLCHERCHPAFDAHKLDLMPFLTLGEQAKAVELSNGLFDALRRITGTRALHELAEKALVA